VPDRSATPAGVPNANTAGAATYPSAAPSAPSWSSARVMKMSDAGLEMTKYCEGLFLKSYQDSGGTYTIGFGRILYDNGQPVGNLERCTQEQAEAWLLEDVEKDGDHFVRAWCSGMNLLQWQWDALSDFSFNCGAGTLHKLLNMPGNLADNIPIADPNKILGRRRRRMMNQAMFLNYDWKKYKDWTP
jgi:GH24 family phage-related lysozyme (muramidase)